MSTNRPLFASFAAILVLTLGCDGGGSKLPSEPEFQGSVSGTVRADGVAVSGTTIRLSGSTVKETQTNSSGSFAFSGLNAGGYVVALSGYPDDMEFPITSESVNVQKGQGSKTVAFVGGLKTDGILSGTVLLEDQGMEGVFITISGPETQSTLTDGDGEFGFTQLRRGSYSVSLSGFDPALHSFLVSQQQVTAVPGPGGEAHFAGTMIPQAPEAPAELSASATGSSTIALAWTDASDDEDRFEIQRKNGLGGTWSAIGSTPANTSTFEDLGLQSGTLYVFRIRSCNEVGCSAFSTEATATTHEVPPEPPTDLVVSATGAYDADLTWADASDNETQFEIQRRQGPAGDWILAGTLGPDLTSFTDSELESNTSYTYRIRACNDVGCSTYSAEASGTTDEVPPEAPSALNAFPTGSASALLTWTDQSDNELRFEVQRKEGTGGSWDPRGTTGADVQSFADPSLTPNTLYNYRVRACNDVGCSAFTAEATVTTDDVPPTPPTSLVATATSSSQISLEWTDASSNEGAFEVERKKGHTGAWTQVATTGPNATTRDDTGLQSKTMYVYRVRACNDMGCSVYSNQDPATTLDVPPEAPSSLGAVETGPDGIDLSWTDEAGNESAFTVERKEGAAGAWAEVATPGANSDSFSDSGLLPSTTYLYRVNACNAVGCSAWSAEASATTTVPPPASPTTLVASATGTTSTQLTWADQADNETSFAIERKLGPSGVYAQVATVAENTAVYGDPGLSPNTTYFYRVSACNAGGCSTPSNQDDATTLDAPPSAPSSLSAGATGPATINLSWTDNAGNETGFYLERKEGAAGSYAQIATLAPNATSHGDSGLTADIRYFYRVRAFNPTGASAFSNESSALTWAGSGPNLTISSMYLTQSTQTLDGDVPLVADRDGLLRVFALASEANSLQPSVRVRFYSGGSLAHTATIPSPLSSVPTSVSEASLSSSWNVDVPGSLIQPGLTILADVDPTDAISESFENDNSFPTGGSPLMMDVRTLPDFAVTFIPVRQSVNNLLGNVTAGNTGQFLDVALRMLPLPGADASLHAEYVSSAPVLESNNGNDAWRTILSEVFALRIAEGSSRYYYGVVKTSYNSGVAGMGYLGWPAAIGWDYLPSGSGVAAHEWGHNWDLRHAPGCGAGSPDPAYPHADGKIGTWGIDLGPKSLKSPVTHYDFMTYCSTDWVSDYHYEKILNFRETHGYVVGPGAPEPSLLVWGRVDEGAIVLEPAFQLDAPPSLPSGSGDFVLEGLSPEGHRLFASAFQPIPIPEVGEGSGHFVFVIPRRLLDAGRLGRLRVTGGGRTPATLESRIRPQTVAPIAPTLTPRGGDVVEVTWDAMSFPMALVRDPATGEILSFARNGRIDLPIQSREIEVVFSDGLRSPERIRRRVR